MKTFWQYLKLSYRIIAGKGVAKWMSAKRRMIAIATIMVSGSTFAGIIGFLIGVALEEKTLTPEVLYAIVILLSIGALSQIIFQVVIGLELIDKKAYETEFKLAESIQKKLLPENLPQSAKFEFAAFYNSANAVGGDYYDVIPLDENRYATVIADISGKGAPASILMSGVRSQIRGLIRQDMSPEKLLAVINKNFYCDTETNQFVTLFFGVIDVENCIIKYTNAGHNPPILISNEGKVRKLESGGIPAGIFEDSVYAGGSEKINPGDRLVLYTDGVTEAKNQKDEMYEEKRLEATLFNNCDKSVQALMDKLVKDISSFTASHEQSDDITILLFGIR